MDSLARESSTPRRTNALMAGMVCKSRRFFGGNSPTSALEPEGTRDAPWTRSRRSSRSLNDKFVITEHLTEFLTNHSQVRHADFISSGTMYVSNQQTNITITIGRWFRKRLDRQ